MRLAQLASLGIALAVLSACASVLAADPSPQPPATSPAIVPAAGPLTAADDGKTITYTVLTKTVSVVLDGNPTTGFSWSITKIDGKSIVPNGEVAYKANPAPGRMVGGGGQFTANFDVKELGKTTFTLEYKRSWETTTPAAKSVTLTINIIPEAVTQPATQK